MSRYLTLLGAVVLQMCIGAMYSYWVYLQPLKTATGLPQTAIELPFLLFYIAFPAVTVFFGWLCPLIGFRGFAIVGGIFYGGGWLLASVGAYNFWLTVVGVGVLGSIGAGFTFIVPIGTCIQWFPKRKGTITGLVIAGFLFGAVLFSYVGKWLVSSLDISPFKAFGFLGLFFILTLPLLGRGMHYLADEEAPVTQPFSFSKVLADRAFWALYLSMAAGLVTGFVVKANLVGLYNAKEFRVGLEAIFFLALASIFGAIIWGLISDRVRPTLAIQANLLCQGVVIIGSVFSLHSGVGLKAIVLMIGFNYGGVLVLFASSAAQRWGDEKVTQVYAWLFSANIPAAVIGVLVGYCWERLTSFALPSAVIVGLLFTSSLFIQKTRANKGVHEV